MRKLLALIIGLAVCFEMAGQIDESVITIDEGATAGSFDYDIRALRNALAPDFTYNYGNWIQYFPGAAVWGLKACGVPSRYDWGQMAVAHAGGSVASLILDHGSKWLIDRMRPDGSRANSFPSGHTTTAFLTATWLQKEYGDQLPWLCGIGYGVATLTAQQRILRNKHWTTDTMAGAILGVAACELGYWLSDVILGKDNYKMFDDFTYETSLKYWEVSYWYSRRLAFDGRHGAAASLQLQAPLGAHWGLTARGVASNIISKTSGGGNNNADDDDRAIISALAGAYYVRQIAPKAELGAHILAGPSWWNDNSMSASPLIAASMATASGSEAIKASVPTSTTQHWKAAGCGADFVAGLSASYVLTQSAKVRVIAEWEALPAAGWLNSVNLGLGGSIYF